MPVLLRKFLGLLLILALIGIASEQALLVSCSPSTMSGNGSHPAIAPPR
ncbi:hypothetical protein [Thiobaca trueperi]|uniref:Uncharacterized protein n=1 Tax=Thiobaca trueperi TaxID=127458 RepID=A0A4R3MZX3_9GAMM|nr:hypothetical protein [Thiobaca trueperi]TCT21994.1 hypothetical protein EDC35_10392 [Thiobaca trueperi]